MDQLSLAVQIFLGAVISASVPTITAFIIRYLNILYERGKMSLKAEQVIFLEGLVAMAVRAAEQSGLSDQIKNTAENKKAYAIDSVQTALATRGIKIDVKEIADKIEEAINLGIQTKSDDTSTEDEDEPTPALGFSIDG